MFKLTLREDPNIFAEPRSDEFIFEADPAAINQIVQKFDDLQSAIEYAICYKSGKDMIDIWKDFFMSFIVLPETEKAAFRDSDDMYDILHISIMSSPFLDHFVEGISLKSPLYDTFTAVRPVKFNVARSIERVSDTAFPEAT